MKALILRFTVAIMAFTFGMTVERLLISRHQDPAPQIQELAAVASLAETPSVRASAVTPTPYAILDYDPVKFDPGGVYRPVGHTPKDLSEFYLFELWSEQNEGKLSGGGVEVLISADKLYVSQKMVFCLLTPRRLVFVTRPRSDEGFEYRFDGEFIQTHPASVANKKTPVLRGILTKSANGQKIAERVVSFRLEQHMGC